MQHSYGQTSVFQNQVLINAPCLSNYLAPSSCCWADVSGEVSTDLPALPGDIAAQRVPWSGTLWAGNVIHRVWHMDGRIR